MGLSNFTLGVTPVLRHSSACYDMAGVDDKGFK